MLIRFKVSNFLSFKEETEFSMVAGKERIHPHHVVKGEKNQPNLLRAALLYGANAAGKSNFVKAMYFARNFVKFYYLDAFNNDDTQYRKYKLDEAYSKKPIGFIFEFISNSRIYEYGFKFDKKVISEEWLIDLTANTQKLLFRRQLKNKKTVFAESDFPVSKSDKNLLHYVQQTTNSKRLFLAHSIHSNIDWFKDAFDWFDKTLEFIFPTSIDFEVEQRIINNTQFNVFFSNLLSGAGTGISKTDVMVNRNGTPVILTGNLYPTFFGNTETSTASTVDKLHLALTHGKNIIFSKYDESDGTRRLFDLAFPFYDLATSETPKVYIIDELERNLHTNLSYMLLKSYLEQTGKGQLIATTHDTHLLDLDLLRRDEIWFAEKDEHGATQLYSLYEFNPRYDKKIEKEYLTGRFGAIPFLGNLEFKKQLAKNGKSKK